MVLTSELEQALADDEWVVRLAAVLAPEMTRECLLLHMRTESNDQVLAAIRKKLAMLATNQNCA